MAYSFEYVKNEIRAMFLKVPEENRAKRDTLIFLGCDYLVIEYGRDEAVAKRNLEALLRQKVYSEKSAFLVEMTKSFFEKKSIIKNAPPQIVGTPLIQFVSTLDKELYQELYG